MQLILRRLLSSANYLNADVRIENTFDDAQTLVVLGPRTHHTKPCGYSGEYVLLPPEFFLDEGGSMTDKFGDLSRFELIAH